MTAMAHPMETSDQTARSNIWLPLLAFALAALCAVVPILLHTYLPLIDLPNHIARHHIAENGQGALSQYYTYVASLVPNSAVDLIWRFTGFPGDPAVFSNYIMAIYAVSFVAMTMLLAFVVQGRWSAWSAGVALLIFNGPFFWGFQNFVVSIPFCLFGLAVWLALERRQLALRLAVFFPLAAALYLMHFFVFAILCIAVFGREIQVQLAAQGSLLRRFTRLSILMLPFAAPVIWLVVGILTGPASPAGTQTEFGTFDERIGIFLSPFIAANTDSVPQINSLGYLSFALLALCFGSIFLRSGPRLVLHKTLYGPVIALVIAGALAPVWLNGVALVHIRVPLVLLAILFAGTQWQGLDRRKLICLTLFIAAVIAIRSVYVERFIAQYDADIGDLLAATETLPAGARVMPIRGPDRQEDYRLSHVQAYMVTKRDAFVPTLFQGVHAIQLKDEWAAYAHPALFAVDVRRILRQQTHPILEGMDFLRDWDQKFTHVLLLDRDTNDIHTDPRLTREAQAGRFTLYSVTPGS